MIGFRQVQIIMWYSEGFENTKVWTGVEIDPIKMDFLQKNGP
jgi:hypothetical protein